MEGWRSSGTLWSCRNTSVFLRSFILASLGHSIVSSSSFPTCFCHFSPPLCLFSLSFTCTDVAPRKGPLPEALWCAVYPIFFIRGGAENWAFCWETTEPTSHVLSGGGSFPRNTAITKKGKRMNLWNELHGQPGLVLCWIWPDTVGSGCLQGEEQFFLEKQIFDMQSQLFSVHISI